MALGRGAAGHSPAAAGAQGQQGQREHGRGPVSTREVLPPHPAAARPDSSFSHPAAILRDSPVLQRNSKLWNARGMLTEGEPRVRHATGNKSLWGAGVKLNPGWWLLEEFLVFSLCFSLLHNSLSSPACCWWGPCVVGMVGCLCTLHCGAKNNHHGELGK